VCPAVIQNEECMYNELGYVAEKILKQSVVCVALFLLFIIKYEIEGTTVKKEN
jgi:hypothetical protein